MKIILWEYLPYFKMILEQIGLKLQANIKASKYRLKDY
jgi:hypothetical protein